MAKTFRPTAILSMVLILIASAVAQTPAPDVSSLIRVKAPETDEVSSPQYDVSVRGMSINRDGRLDWLQVMAEYDTALDWTDEITFTFYVALQGELQNLPEGSKPVNVFSGTTTLINVPKNRDHMIDMFLDPNTFARYGKVFAIALEVSVNGQPLPEPLLVPDSPQMRQRMWWESETPNAIPLLSRSETPFRMIEIDRQGTVQP